MNEKRIILSIIDYTGGIVDEVSKEVLNFSPQLFSKSGLQVEPLRPEPYASGVLIKVEGNHFLLTAGHVVEDVNPEDVGVMINNTFFILEGEVKYARPSDSEQNDKIDLAVWELNDEVIDSLSAKYKFLEFQDIEYDHQTTTEPKYLIVGFPVTRSKLNVKTAKIKVAPFIFLTKQAEEKFYERLGFEKHSTLLLDYRKAKIESFDTKLVLQGPKPQGISGCGLWYLPKLIVNEGQKVPVKLVGIMIEHHNQFNVVVATRIHVVTEILRRDFGINIPESKITRLK